MSLRTWFHGPRQLLLVFLVIVLLPSTLLVASGWRLMQQEERLAIQEQQTKRDQMADLVVAKLQQQLTAIETRLRGTPGQLASEDVADDAVLVVVEGDAVTTVPARRLLYYPVSAPGREAPFGAFGEGERLELQNHNYAEAAAWYEKTATSVDPAIRAGASVREARSLGRLGQVDAALSALALASGTHNASVAGIPADLFARFAECELLASAGRHDELRRKAEALHADLLGGRWRLSRAAFEANVLDAAKWFPVTAATESSASARALSAGFEWVWQHARESRANAVITSGRELVNADGREVTVVWRGDATRLAAFVAGSDFVETQWLASLRDAATAQQLGISLRGPGASAGPARETRRVAGETRLPWTVAVTSTGAPQAAASTDRFRIWLASVAVLALIVIAGTTVIARAAARELAVARLQSDFVAAVSHEFRTPLTYLRQIGEVLQDGRVSSDERRRTYFDALVRQTDRLAHLVETLLDFGRMEAGTSPYRKEPLNLSSWVRSVVEQFNLEAAGRGYSVELTASDEAVPIQGDPQALTNALWNLLDNAVKYSPECRTVWVTVDRRGDEVTVHVRDRGLGVPAAEHRDIFQKFVRGADAKRRNIAGTGIGLAMVQHIMQAHNGSVRVESEPGHGSTFTLVLPCHAS